MFKQICDEDEDDEERKIEFTGLGKRERRMGLYSSEIALGQNKTPTNKQGILMGQSHF